MQNTIKSLNEFLSDLNVFYRKLQNYHWNIEGKSFFVFHAKLEEYYDQVNEQIDEIAEHILALGYQPLGTMQDFMKNSEIQEAKNERIKSIPIIKNLIQDLEILKQKAVKIKEEAEKQSDYATSALMDNYLGNYSKKLFNSCKRKRRRHYFLKENSRRWNRRKLWYTCCETCRSSECCSKKCK